MEGAHGQAGDRPRLLVLGAGPAQLGLLAAAQERGVPTIAADRDPAAPGFRLASRRAIVSAEDEPALERLARAEQVGGVIAPGIDWPVAIAARIAERLGIRHPLDPATAVLATSKLRQRARLEERGVPQPRWVTVTEAGADVDVEPPCVVKAPDRQGQRGLTLVRERSELAGAIRAAVEASRARAAVVEELVDGPEVTVSAFSIDGEFYPLTVTDRLTAEPPAFGVALAHAYPSEAAGRDVVELARAAAEALGILNGPTYTQLRVGTDGPRVMEVAARLGGGHDAELCRAALGVDLNALALAAALGEPVDPPAPTPMVGGGCTRFLVAPPGELRQIEGAAEARALDGVVELYVYRAPGYAVQPLRTGADRAGAVIAVGDSREDALRKAGLAAGYVRFETSDAQALV